MSDSPSAASTAPGWMPKSASRLVSRCREKLCVRGKWGQCCIAADACACAGADAAATYRDNVCRCTHSLRGWKKGSKNMRPYLLSACFSPRIYSHPPHTILSLFLTLSAARFRHAGLTCRSTSAWRASILRISPLAARNSMAPASNRPSSVPSAACSCGSRGGSTVCSRTCIVGPMRAYSVGLTHA
eukprot:350512-Chlamydomonas_euryale.AAC.5